MTTVREALLSSLIPPCGYHNKMDHVQNNYIDGLGHVSLAKFAADKIGDVEVSRKCYDYTAKLKLWSIRAYGPKKLTGSWERLPGTGIRNCMTLYGHTKPQAFAGPCAYAIATGDDYAGVKPKARILCLAFTMAPFLFRYTSLRQHLNSVMLAHLLLSKKPRWYKKWLCKDNPVYAYLCGVKLSEYKPYPDCGPWPAKDLLFMSAGELDTYRSDWPDDWEYTPLCKYVGDALQRSM